MQALKSQVGLKVRQHLFDQVLAKPKPRYLLAATHWLGVGSGPTFRDAGRYLAEETEATVITTTFAPD